MKRIVTRPDFDGVVCAALLYEAENVKGPVKWVEPNDMQKGLVDTTTIPTESTNRSKALLRLPLRRQASFSNIIKIGLNVITAN